MHCYKKNDVIFVGDLDVKRVSREIKKLWPTEISLDQAQEIFAKSLSFPSYYRLQQEASDPDVSSKTGNELFNFFRDNLVTKGEKFPQKLPAKFDAAWRNSAVKLIESALDQCSSKAFEFVALVGATGSGKTLLARDLCYRHDGRLIDVGNLCTPNLAMIPGLQTSSLLVLDQSVAPLEVASDKPLKWNEVFDRLKRWDDLPTNQRRWSNFLALTRKRERGIPEFGGGMGLPDLRQHLGRNRNRRVVICYADISEARQAMHSASAVFARSEDQHLAYNWNRAHVVDLDSLTTSTIERESTEKLRKLTEEERFFMNNPPLINVGR